MLTRKKLPFLNPHSWIDQNDTAFIDAYCTRKNLENVHVLCMAEATETFHHWQVFGAAGSGVCIIFRDEFKHWLERQSRLIARPVIYKSVHDIMQHGHIQTDGLPSIKRSGFEDEKEYRVICEELPLAGETAVYIGFPISLIGRIVFSPFIPTPLVDSGKYAISLIDGCSLITCTQSNLTNSSRWKQAAEAKGVA